MHKQIIELAQRAEANGALLTLRQLAILSVMASGRGPFRVRHIASKLGIGKPAVTRACDTLADLIERRTDSNDGRDVALWLTDKGQRLMASLAAEAPRHAA